MMNNQASLDLAERFAERLVREVGDLPAAQVRRASLLALGVEATEQEVADACAFIDMQRTYFQQQAELAAAKVQAKPEKEKPVGKKPTAPAARELSPEVQAVALYCQALLSSNQFLYVD
jgi:hypothetical protein